eukprot:560608-Rhodomonas_salina.12
MTMLMLRLLTIIITATTTATTTLPNIIMPTALTVNLHTLSIFTITMRMLLPGYYALSEPPSVCLPCAAGLYKDFAGQSTCRY